MSSIRQLVDAGTAALANQDQDSPRLEAELLLGAALDRSRTYLMTWPERTPTPEQQTRYRALLKRRVDGQPIAHILGHREFWSLDLWITPDVLIPRPETELLVELALQAYPAHSAIIAADLGTGSGAIAAALAVERPAWRILATDQSAAALAVATENFRRLGLDSIEARLGHWCQALPAGQRFDLVVSNPPYIRLDDAHLTRGDVRHEPRSALSAGADGLDDLRQIARQAGAYLRTGGLLLLEHGFDQGRAVRDILSAAGYLQPQTHRDLAGRDRVSSGHAAPG